jgi:acetoacetyl-CoA synthetase
LQVPAIPHTITGKSLEVPIKRLLQGVPMERAVSTGVVDDPSLLNYYVELGAPLGRARQAGRAQ